MRPQACLLRQAEHRVATTATTLHVEEPVNLDLFWIALWKHVLLVEVIRERYKVNTPGAKETMLAAIRTKISRDPAKKAALAYLDEFEGRFWCETDERVREITDQFADKINGEVGVNANTPLTAGVGASASHSHEVRKQQAERFQRIVNSTQLAKLNKMLDVLNDDILDPQHYTFVVIDDLDRDWVDERLANDLVRCLFRTVLDLKRVANLKVLVALRTNIFQELDFGLRGGAQEEKFRSVVLTMRWTRADLEKMLDERVRLAVARADLNEIHSLQDVLPNANKSRNPVEYMFDRTLMRPRDAIAFINECLSVGIGKTRLSWDDIVRAGHSYSSKRLLALRDEWKVTYPGIDRVMEKFRGAPARMSRGQFQTRLD